MHLYDLTATQNSGKVQSMSEFKGKALLIVNTASKCGFTKQYNSLEALYKEFNSQGFEILGFPCNQFGQQEPGNDDEIATFCERNFGVTFPLYKKIEVNGDNTDPIFKLLKSEAPGLLGTKRIKWNFTKFLVNTEGKVLKRFAPTVDPLTLKSEISAVLSA